MSKNYSLSCFLKLCTNISSALVVFELMGLNRLWRNNSLRATIQDPLLAHLYNRQLWLSIKLDSCCVPWQGHTAPLWPRPLTLEYLQLWRQEAKRFQWVFNDKRDHSCFNPSVLIYSDWKHYSIQMFLILWAYYILEEDILSPQSTASM